MNKGDVDTLDSLFDVYLDGKKLEAVLTADTDSGEVKILEKHYSTGETVRNPDGTPSVITLKGKVEKKPKWDLSFPADLVSDMAYDILKSYAYPTMHFPCTFCGGMVQNGYCHSCGTNYV